MGAENRVSLKVDAKKRIGVSDVITMLKGLRSEAVIKIVRTSDVKDNAGQDAINITSTVTGNTELPQIRELNEIAALLRSMDSKQNQLGN